MPASLYRDAGRLGRPVPAQQRSDPGRVISMSIAIIDTFSRTMGISFHLLFVIPAPPERGASCVSDTDGRAVSEAHFSTAGIRQSRTGVVRWVPYPILRDDSCADSLR